MTKNEYIKRLKEKLVYLPIDQVDDILYDYEEHFQIGIEHGKTEDEIAKELGKPEMIAAQYRYSQVLDDLEPHSESLESKFRRKYQKMMDTEIDSEADAENAYTRTRQNKIPKTKPFKLIRAMMMAIGLGFFNIVFVLGLYLGVVGVLLGLLIASIAIVISGIVVVVAGLFPFLPMGSMGYLPSIYSSIMLVSGGLAMVAGGTLAIILLYRAGVGMYNWTVRYLKTNLRMIQKAGE